MTNDIQVRDLIAAFSLGFFCVSLLLIVGA